MNVAETDLPANHLPCIARWQLTAAVTLSNRRYTKPVLFLHKWKYKNKIKLMSKIMIILKIHIPISKHSRENPICYVTKHMKINSSFNLNTTSSFHVAESSLNWVVDPLISPFGCGRQYTKMQYLQNTIITMHKINLFILEKRTHFSTCICFTGPNLEHSSWTSSLISKSKSGSV